MRARAIELLLIPDALKVESPALTICLAKLCPRARCTIAWGKSGESGPLNSDMHETGVYSGLSAPSLEDV